VALEWTHAFLRLLLKYREIVRLEGFGERVLALSRTLRRLRERLRDPEFSWLAVVALPESLSVPETARLIRWLREREMPVGALIINRLLTPGPGGDVAVEATAEAVSLL